jgi:hypothetical protein
MMWRYLRLMSCVVVVFATLGTRPATAGDVKLIKPSHTFPYMITAPGSYRLKANFTVPDANTTAIKITSDNVTLDLNGYTVSGPTVCSGLPVTSCAPTGTGNGIDALGFNNVKVTNGVVQGMGRDGIDLGDDCVVDGVRAKSNGNKGVAALKSARITGTTATANGSLGLSCDPGCQISDSSATYNLDKGIDARANSTLTGDRANSNGLDGINLGDNGIVTRSTANSNGNAGITAQANTTISNNVASNNADDGIVEGAGSVVSGNSVNGNAAFGLNLGSGTGYANNAANDNNGGNGNPQVAGGVETGANVCGGDTICP